MNAARGVIAAALGVTLALGCARKAPAPVATESVAATRADALINAGNSAFQQGDYKLAARRYAAAAVHRPDDPAAFYGLGMALAKLGRDEDARAAYARARELGYRQQQQ
ncbi:MAG: tetratricopeptide repeat protein [Gaiellaceae bacterium]